MLILFWSYMVFKIIRNSIFREMGEKRMWNTDLENRLLFFLKIGSVAILSFLYPLPLAIFPYPFNYNLQGSGDLWTPEVRLYITKGIQLKGAEEAGHTEVFLPSGNTQSLICTVVQNHRNNCMLKLGKAVVKINGKNYDIFLCSLKNFVTWKTLLMSVENL